MALFFVTSLFVTSLFVTSLFVTWSGLAMGFTVRVALATPTLDGVNAGGQRRR